MTANAVIQIVVGNHSLASMMRAAVQLGGDTDSVAALVVAIGSCSKEVADDLPEALTTGLESGDEDRQNYLKAIDRKLWRLAT